MDKGQIILYQTLDGESKIEVRLENENKLVRQYIPKGTNISSVSDAKIWMVRTKNNARPRQKLNFSTPAEVFFKNIS